MVCRHRREPHLAGGAGLLSVAAARSFVGHRRGRDTGCRRAHALDARCAASIAQADLCIRAGYLALRRIADFFQIAYNANPQPGDPISISRDEFDAACDELARHGVPLKADRDQAWRDFAGWRVNYDTVLLALAAITMAPYAPWSSDRSLLPARRRPTDRAHPMYTAQRHASRHLSRKIGYKLYRRCPPDNGL